MSEINLQEHYGDTYQTLRHALFWIGILLPFLLMIGGKIWRNIPFATHSMSAYYHLSASPGKNSDGSFDYSKIPENLGVMRNVFVGGLFAIGTLLITYKGIRPIENWVLNVGGVLAWGVAYFPMNWKDLSKPTGHPSPTSKKSSSISLHGLCAAGVFLCIGYVCIFRAQDTLVPALMPDEEARQKFSLAYQFLGWAMVLFPVSAWWLLRGRGKNHVTFWVEAAGIWVFAMFWGVKTLELKSTNTFEIMAAEQQYKTQEIESFTDLFKKLPVEKWN